MIIRELIVKQGRRVEIPHAERLITMPEHAANILTVLIGDRTVEHMMVLHLDGRHKVLGYEQVAQGDLNLVHAQTASIVRGAVIAGAVGIILGHNHPSGDPRPSAEDIALTRRVNAACDLLNLKLLDHLVVTASGAFESMAACAVFDSFIGNVAGRKTA